MDTHMVFELSTELALLCSTNTTSRELLVPTTANDHLQNPAALYHPLQLQ